MLGSGVDRIYPSRHANTVRQILEEGRGAIVSELALGTAPDAGNFPRRNRIIAGLSVATVVAEARVSGGALLTAMMALEQNREVFALPASVFSEAPGHQHAHPARLRGPRHLRRRHPGRPRADPPAPLASLATAGSASGASGLAPVPDDLSADERRLLDALSPEPRQFDAVCSDAGLDTSTALVYLLQLEFRGLVRQLAGKQFYRA